MHSSKKEAAEEATRSREREKAKALREEKRRRRVGSYLRDVDWTHTLQCNKIHLVDWPEIAGLDVTPDVVT
jgi:hypothetical protein